MAIPSQTATVSVEELHPSIVQEFVMALPFSIVQEPAVEPKPRTVSESVVDMLRRTAMAFAVVLRSQIVQVFVVDMLFLIVLESVEAMRCVFLLFSTFMG